MSAAPTSPAPAAATDPTAGGAVEPLRMPRDGVPAVVTDRAALADLIERVRAGTGPVAFDAERASGYRYGQRAYLVQLRREGAGTGLIDPVACPDLSGLQAAVGTQEWVLHAASQDLPCLAELGLVPTSLFDTELAGRLAGYPRVSLGAMVEALLHRSLEKGHSAADWSRRPLPEPWLRYAALDVELLLELRERLAAELAMQGKLDWARQEFAAVLAARPAGPRVDPWRRTSGIHRVRNRAGLAVVRSLWVARDEIARARNLAPGRLLPDAAIVSAALSQPASPAELAAIRGFGGRAARRHADRWWQALREALAEPPAARPQPAPAGGAGGAGDPPPPAHRWGDRDPAAAARLVAARAAVGAVSQALGIPVENLLSPDTVRRLAWAPPDPARAETVAAALRDRGARPWQVELTAGPLAGALADAARS